jgi:hypothetical protein
MIQVSFNGVQKYYLFPEKWEELTQEQFILFIRVLNTEDNLERAKIKIAQKLLNVPDRIYYNLLSLGKYKEEHKIDAKIEFMASQYSEELFPYMEYLFDNKPFMVNPIKDITGKKNVLYGPKDGYEDVTIGEIEEADQAYQMYRDTSDIKWLKRMVAILYRPKQFSLKGNKSRIDYNIDKIEDIETQLEKVDEVILKGVKFIYERILAWYAAHPIYKQLFAGGGEDATPDIKGWSRLIRGLSGEKLGTIDMVRKMKLYDALDQLFLAQKEVEEIKQ